MLSIVNICWCPHSTQLTAHSCLSDLLYALLNSSFSTVGVPIIRISPYRLADNDSITANTSSCGRSAISSSNRKSAAVPRASTDLECVPPRYVKMYVDRESTKYFVWIVLGASGSVLLGLNFSDTKISLLARNCPKRLAWAALGNT